MRSSHESERDHDQTKMTRFSNACFYLVYMGKSGLILGNRHDLGILTPAMADDLAGFLPPIQKESRQWELVYSTREHGISFKTMMANCAQGPLLLLIRTVKDAIFGGYLSDGLKIQKGYYGNGTCFLFQRYPDHEPMRVFPATGKNEYYILTEENTFAMGGGSARFGLWFDSELWNGYSEPCDTFASKTLSKQTTFQIESLEVWRFKL